MSRRIAEEKGAIVIAVLTIFLGVLFLRPGWIKPDSAGTFVYLRSAVLDQDLSFLNEWNGFGMVKNGLTYFKEVDAEGRLRNHWWIGASLLASVPYAMVHLLTGGDGFSSDYTLLLAWFAVLCTAFTLVVAVKSSAAGNGAPIVGAAAVLVGTPLFFYTYLMPLGTHAAGALTVALLCRALAKETTSPLLTGITFGLTVCTRLQHFVLGGSCVIAKWKIWSPREWAAFALGSIAGWSPQALAWWVIYDHPLGPLARGANLQGVTWMPFTTNALFEVLFSSWHGLLAWSPVVALAIAGWMTRRRDRFSWTLAAMFAGEWLANGLLDRYFWGGMGFGGRRFVDLAVPFAIGIAWLVDRRTPQARAAMISLTAVASTFNIALMIPAMRGSLDLARDPGFATLLSSAAEGIMALTLPSVSFPSATVSIAIAMTAALWWCLRKERPLLIALLTLIAIADVAIATMRSRTLQHSRFDAQRLRVDIDRAGRFGPLLDQRNLLIDLEAHLRLSGKTNHAMEVRREIDATESTLGELLRGR